MPGPEDGYIDICDRALLEKNKEFKQDYFPLRPSSAGHCTRKLSYDLAAYLGLRERKVESKPPETIMLLDLGWYIEQQLVKAFRNCAEWFKLRYSQQVVEMYQLRAKDIPELEFLVEGSLDSCFVSDKWKAVIDYKSKKDKFNKAFKTDWDNTSDKLAKLAKKINDRVYWVENLDKFLEALEVKDPFFADNFYQLNCYACSPFLIKRGIDHGVIIQYNKNDSRKREIRFRPSTTIYNKIKAKFQKALDAVAEGSPEFAPKDFLLGSIKCAFCPYKTDCWNDDALQAYFKTFPKKVWPKDLRRLKNKKSLGELFNEFEKGATAIVDYREIEQEIIKLLRDQATNKVKLDNTHVYEIKYLKSPKEHFELRRSKL